MLAGGAVFGLVYATGLVLLAAPRQKVWPDGALGAGIGFAFTPAWIADLSLRGLSSRSATAATWPQMSTMKLLCEVFSQDHESTSIRTLCSPRIVGCVP